MAKQSHLTWGELCRTGFDTLENHPDTAKQFRKSMARIAAFADAFHAICQEITPEQNRIAHRAFQESMHRQGYPEE